MLIFNIIAYIIGGFGIVGTVLPFLPYDDFWIRGFDYPRQQLMILLAVSAGFWFVGHNSWTTYDWVFGVALALAALYQAYRILPYTRLWNVQSRRSEQPIRPETSLSLMVANVLQTNNDYQKLIDLVDEKDPDLLLTLETDKVWERAMYQGFGDRFPHTVDIPLDNLYGMHLFSKKELIDPKTLYRIKDDIPGIDTKIRLGNGREVDLYFIHPMPPSPSEAYASTGRDAELAQVGLQVKDSDRTTIVAGDLNDVAWSHSSRLFQRISGMLDPRRGRGLFATFHAEYWFARWPLDHVFHSTDLALVKLERLRYIGSDHFPVYIEFNYEPGVSAGQEHEADADEIEEAKETLAKGQRQEDDVLIEQ